MSAWVRFGGWGRKMLLTGLCGLLAACSTTGSSFDSSGLSRFVVGQTTLPQAVALLKAQPQAVYQARDGSALVRWAHKASLLTDAIYVRQELSVQFGADGRFSHIVERINVADQPEQPASASSPQTVQAPAQTTDPVGAGLPRAVPQAFPYQNLPPSGVAASYPVH